MFQKKEYIYSETLGVCQVENITNLTAGRSQQIAYYVLRPIFAKEEVSYIPVENHEVHLRSLFSREEAQAILEDSNIDLEKDSNLKDAIDFVLHGKSEE